MPSRARQGTAARRGRNPHYRRSGIIVKDADTVADISFVAKFGASMFQTLAGIIFTVKKSHREERHLCQYEIRSVA
jgi:hypothetical protein